MKRLLIVFLSLTLVLCGTIGLAQPSNAEEEPITLFKDAESTREITMYPDIIAHNGVIGLAGVSETVTYSNASEHIGWYFTHTDGKTYKFNGVTVTTTQSLVQSGAEYQHVVTGLVWEAPILCTRTQI